MPFFPQAPARLWSWANLSPVLQWGCVLNPDEVLENICPAACLLPLVSTAHTPDNSFMGFVSEELNQTERQFIKSNKVSSMAVVYGKEASIWKVSAPMQDGAVVDQAVR